MKTLAQNLVNFVTARSNCIKCGNTEWKLRWEEQILASEKELPSGGGFGKTRVNLDETTPDKLVIESSFHKMNDTGYYTGIEPFSIVATPDWNGVKLKIKAKKKFLDEYGDFIYEVFSDALSAEK